MRAGRRSVPVTILQRGSTKSELGHRTRTTTEWRVLWGGFKSLRGGESGDAQETIVRTMIEVTFDYADVMIDQGDGKGMLDETMVLSIEGRLYDITSILPNFDTRREVRVQAVQTRVVT